MLKDLFHLFFPRLCPSCSRLLLDQEKAYCWNCILSIEKTGFHASPSNNELYNRLAAIAPIDAAAALFYFDKGGKLQKIISALKYHHQPKIGIALGELYGNELKNSEFIEHIEAIIPVPLHPKREAERGYNQAAEIAEGLSNKTGIPFREDILKRKKASRSQTRKGKEERWENVKDLFEVNHEFQSGVLLVDDIITTGSTILGCARAFAKTDNPPGKVAVLSIGITRKLD